MTAWVIGNWKQNPATAEQAQSLCKAIAEGCSTANFTHCQLMVIPAQVHLSKVAESLMSSAVQLGAQDISAHSATTGAYTGDCSASQIKDIGANWVLVGHSERRQYHGEDHLILEQKITHALNQQLGVIYCIGETESEYESGQTLSVLRQQLDVIKSIFANSSFVEQEGLCLMIAYEPVWAIGTGKIPTITEVSTVHAYIKQVVSEFSEAFATVKVLYGGSVNADNAREFAMAKDVDGALVGGASLKADSFLAIAQAFNQSSV